MLNNKIRIPSKLNVKLILLIICPKLAVTNTEGMVMTMPLNNLTNITLDKFTETTL